MSDVTEIMDALATQLDTVLGTAIADLQVTGRMMFDPTPPAIDVYPSDPFQEGLTFGKANNEFHFTVRARVTTADNEAGQDLLLSMMDPKATTSVAQALLSDKTLSGKAGNLGVEGPSNFGLFPDVVQSTSALLGCTWTVTVIP